MANRIDQVIGLIEKNREDFIEDLKEILRIPSVSADPARAGEVRRCAEWLADRLKRAGLEHATLHEIGGHPLVTADWLHAQGKPTVLIYGHYDVQPDDPVDLWETPPFEPTIRDGKIWARGATDDKGQLMMHVHALESYLAVHGSLPVNVKIMMEGEEEIATENLSAFVAANKDLLSADVIVVSDTGMFSKELPGITVGLRGLVYMQLDLTGPGHDLHSGSFGGGVENPANALAAIIASMKDEAGKVLIPGFYDDVVPLTDEERAEFARLPYDEERFLKETGAPKPFGEEGYTVLERMSARPTLDVNGIFGGFAGEGPKTVLPSKAGAKISMRLVPNQDPDRIARLFEEHVARVCPDTVRFEIRQFSGAYPFVTPLTDPSLQAAARALERAFGIKPVFIREGGSIPVVATLSENLGIPIVLMGFGLPSENAHAPNENFDLDNYHKGTLSSAYLMEELSLPGK